MSLGKSKQLTLDCYCLALRATHRCAGRGRFHQPLRVQASLDARAQQTEPLILLAAVIWQCAPALGEGGSCGGATELLASQICTPKRERVWGWRDGDPSIKQP